jgi:hypothetical protein
LPLVLGEEVAINYIWDRLLLQQREPALPVHGGGVVFHLRRAELMSLLLEYSPESVGGRFIPVLFQFLCEEECVVPHLFPVKTHRPLDDAKYFRKVGGLFHARRLQASWNEVKNFCNNNRIHETKIAIRETKLEIMQCSDERERNRNRLQVATGM